MEQYLAVLQLFLVLPAVIVAAWLLIRFAGRYMLPGGRHNFLRVIERLPLDNRSAVYLLKVHDRLLLLAVSAGRISLLQELTGAEWPLEDAAPLPAGSLFAGLLNRLRSREGGDD